MPGEAYTYRQRQVLCVLAILSPLQSGEPFACAERAGRAAGQITAASGVCRPRLEGRGCAETSAGTPPPDCERRHRGRSPRGPGSQAPHAPPRAGAVKTDARARRGPRARPGGRPQRERRGRSPAIDARPPDHPQAKTPARPGVDRPLRPPTLRARRSPSAFLPRQQGSTRPPAVRGERQDPPRHAAAPLNERGERQAGAAAPQSSQPFVAPRRRAVPLSVREPQTPAPTAPPRETGDRHDLSIAA